MAQTRKTPTVLIVLDGFGHREAAPDNAISNANTPTWDRLKAECPNTLISGSGLDVGLPDGQMGNSEVGHMSLGAGRVIYQQMTRIDKAIQDGEFFDNPAYNTAIDAAVTKGGAVHVLGLLSPGGVHSHERHFHAMVESAVKRGAERIYVHAFLDGRDTPPQSAKASLEALDAKLEALLGDRSRARIASIVGRYFAMDRDNRWDRVEKAYRLLTDGSDGAQFDNALAGLDAAYARDETDEFVAPSLIQADGEDSGRIADGDAVLFMNFRADRARELSHAILDEEFSHFERGQRLQLAGFVQTSEYAADIEAPVAFPPEDLHNSIGEVMQQQGKTQLRIAETEKYAHVTFFFSGGREAEYTGETRQLIPSPDVATYDLKPEMSAPELTDQLTAAIESGDYDLIVCNYANGDMVGHTGVFEAAVKAVECLDSCLARIEASIQKVGGNCLITADHGNCEQMVNHEAGQPHTQHTTERVPLVYVGPKKLEIHSGGVLADVAPTLLGLMGLPKPDEMTGRDLTAGA